MNADNSTKIGLAGQVGPVKAEGSVHLGNAFQGLGKLIHAGLSYIEDQIE